MSSAHYDQALAELREATVELFTSEIAVLEAMANARDAGATTNDLKTALERILKGRHTTIDLLIDELGLR